MARKKHKIHGAFKGGRKKKKSGEVSHGFAAPQLPGMKANNINSLVRRKK